MLHSAISPHLATHEEPRSLLIFQIERQIAAYVDNLNPGDGKRGKRGCAVSASCCCARPRR